MNDQAPIDINKSIDLRWMDDHNRLVSLYRNESDRAAALLAASFLDSQLMHAVKRILVDDAKVIDVLFSGYAPLSSFSARIDLVYAMGHIPPGVRDDLHTIRHIRNHFAHHDDVTDFNTRRVKDWCRLLSSASRPYEGKEVELDSRTRFLHAVSYCVSDIRNGLQSVPRPSSPASRY